MISLRPFQRWHYRALQEISAPQGGKVPFVTDDTLRGLERGNSFTVFAGDKPIAAGGTINLWPTHHQAWTYLTDEAAKHLIPITRFAVNGMRGLQGRITMTTPIDFEAGKRWALLLGFKVETPLLKCYGPLGEDHVGFIKLQD